MKTVKEVSAITGVSVRTLHHYDAIGLLKPTQVTQAGYRLYDETALERMQTILLFRALRFPLKEIKAILDTPGFDPREALTQQIALLEMQRDHLNEIISHARNLQKTGVFSMDFKTFDTTQLDHYTQEAKKKWGKTQAWAEFEEKSAGKTGNETQSAAQGLMGIFEEFGKLLGTSPESSEAQALVAQLQSFITRHYYTCTPEILRGLAELYIAGDSMTENIEQAGGKGTAQFAHDAISRYCQ